jgi:hypothetical protein
VVETFLSKNEKSKKVIRIVNVVMVGYWRLVSAISKLNFCFRILFSAPPPHLNPTSVVVLPVLGSGSFVWSLCFAAALQLREN